MSDSDLFCLLFAVFDMINHFLSRSCMSHEESGPSEVFSSFTPLIAFGLFSVDDSVV